MRLHHPLKPGDMVPMTLVFEKAGQIHVKVPVRQSRSKHKAQ
jgi:copper(I)-binding protein